jgi:hypothetical protein
MLVTSCQLFLFEGTPALQLTGLAGMGLALAVEVLALELAPRAR